MGGSCVTRRSLVLYGYNLSLSFPAELDFIVETVRNHTSTTIACMSLFRNCQKINNFVSEDVQVLSKSTVSVRQCQSTKFLQRSTETTILRGALLS